MNYILRLLPLVQASCKEMLRCDELVRFARAPPTDDIRVVAFAFEPRPASVSLRHAKHRNVKLALALFNVLQPTPFLEVEHIYLRAWLQRSVQLPGEGVHVYL